MDEKVWTQFGMYLSIGGPNCVIIFLDWASVQILTLMSGKIGVVDLATQTVSTNIVAILWGIPSGIKQAAYALVGQEFGAGNVS